MKFELYQAADGWRWRLRAASRRTVADSGEAYTTKQHARRAISKVVDGMLAMFRRHGEVQVVELAGAPLSYIFRSVILQKKLLLN